MTSRSCLLIAVLSASPGHTQGPVDTPCLVQSQTIPDGILVELPSSVGLIRLPARTVPGAHDRMGGGRQFVLEDSTTIDIWISPSLAPSVAKDAGVSSLTQCETRVGRFAALVTSMTMSIQERDPVFLGILTIIIDEKRAVYLGARTATAASRDAMVGMLASNVHLP